MWRSYTAVASQTTGKGIVEPAQVYWWVIVATQRDCTWTVIMMALVDTGSGSTLHEVNDKLSIALAPNKTQLMIVTGVKVSMNWKGLLSVHTVNQEVAHEFWLFNIQEPFIIGFALLSHWGAQIDIKGKTDTLGKETVELQLHQSTAAQPMSRPQDATTSIEPVDNPSIVTTEAIYQPCLCTIARLNASWLKMGHFSRGHSWTFPCNWLWQLLCSGGNGLFHQVAKCACSSKSECYHHGRGAGKKTFARSGVTEALQSSEQVQNFNSQVFGEICWQDGLWLHFVGKNWDRLGARKLHLHIYTHVPFIDHSVLRMLHSSNPVFNKIAFYHKWSLRSTSAVFSQLNKLTDGWHLTQKTSEMYFTQREIVMG